MALGAAGPPATPRQVQYLKALVEKAGYESFRVARRPLGLTQRQATGKFTKQEASALIDRLTNGEAPDAATAADAEPESVLHDTRSQTLRGMPAQLLADELVRRGWSVTAPD